MPYEALNTAIRDLDALQRHVADLAVMQSLIADGAEAMVIVDGVPNAVPLRPQSARSLVEGEHARYSAQATRIREKLEAAMRAVA